MLHPILMGLLSTDQTAFDTVVYSLKCCHAACFDRTFKLGNLHATTVLQLDLPTSLLC